MKSYLIKWILASLSIPALLLIINKLINIPDYLILVLWPSSIALMALDTNQPPSAWHISYVWAVSLSLNVALYVVIGLAIKLFTRVLRQANEQNS